jgi:hypothetical protein
LPKDVVDDDRRLTYVLLHGSDEFGTGWDVSWIAPPQARKLLAFLENEVGDSKAYSLVDDLRRYLAKAIE